MILFEQIYHIIDAIITHRKPKVYYPLNPLSLNLNIMFVYIQTVAWNIKTPCHDATCGR